LKIGSLIITYNPDNCIVEKVENLLNQCDHILIIDNCSRDKKKIKLINERFDSKQVFIIENKKNIGLSKALNQGVNYFFEKDFKYCLLLDQDSRLSKNFLPILLSTAATKEEVAIVSPLIISTLIEGPEFSVFVKKLNNYFFKKIKILDGEIKEVGLNITSGSLINIGIWNKIGRFREDLFIEGIDDEYCLKVIKNDLKIIVNGNAKLYQQYGNMKTNNKKKLWNPTNHASYRYRYLFRNKILIMKTCNVKCIYYLLFQTMSLLKKIMTITLFEKNKLKNIVAIFKGIIDGIMGKSGEII